MRPDARHPGREGQALSSVARREFLRWASASPLVFAGCASARRSSSGPADAVNLFDLQSAARERLSEDAFAYLEGGADDMHTVRANCEGFRTIAIRPRRLVDVREVDTRLELFGTTLRTPILLAPVGFQAFFHEEGELATARAAAARDHQMFVSSVSSYSVGEVASASRRAPWFQLYPTPNRQITRELLRRAEAAGSTVVALTVDTPVIGNRERHADILRAMLAGENARMGNFEGLLQGESINDPGMTWDMVGWLSVSTSMHVVLKGIVTGEDAALAVERGADGVIVSNHGGRQLESERATIECLPEVVEAVDGRIPVLIDGGFRRGTDVFKALALGASAICIGRPFCWGLAAYGQAGVERALEILQSELELDMQLAGTVELTRIGRACVT